jgi:hypothetical protein
LHSSGHQTSDVITGKKESQELPDVKKGLERDLTAFYSFPILKAVARTSPRRWYFIVLGL